MGEQEWRMIQDLGELGRGWLWLRLRGLGPTDYVPSRSPPHLSLFPSCFQISAPVQTLLYSLLSLAVLHSLWRSPSPKPDHPLRCRMVEVGCLQGFVIPQPSCFLVAYGESLPRLAQRPATGNRDLYGSNGFLKGLVGSLGKAAMVF